MADFSMKRTIMVCKAAGFIFLTIILIFSHFVCPTEGYWSYRLFETSNGSTIRITGDTSTLEWEMGQIYASDVNVTLYSLGTGVARIYDVNLEYKWTSGDFEDNKTSEGSYELAEIGQVIEMTFEFNPTMDTYGLKEGDSWHGALQYQLSFKEDINGTSINHSTGWQNMFYVEVQAPDSAPQNSEDFDPLLIGGGGVVAGVVIGAVMLTILQSLFGSKRPKSKRKVRPRRTAFRIKACQFCQTVNDFDAVFCKKCGMEIE